MDALISMFHCWFLDTNGNGETVRIRHLTTSFPGLSYEDEARHEKALVWAGQFCILIG